MISVIDRKQTDNGTLKKYVADTYSELQDSSEKVCGDIAYCIEDKSWHLLNSSSEWVKLGNSEDLTEIREAIKKWIVPIGKRYVQYPGDALPNVFFSDLFGGDDASTWTKEFADEGITFSTEGGQALAFNGGIQESCNKAHNHNASSGNQSADHTHWFTWTGSHSHRYIGPLTTKHWGYPDYMIQVGRGGMTTDATSITVSGNTGNDSVPHNHTITVANDGATEARMKNRTYCIWRRTA